MIVSEDKVDHALKILADKDGVASAARAAHEYESDLIKVVKAQIMTRCNEKTIAAREMFALAHPDYKAHLERVQILAEQDYHHRDRRAAATAVIDAWRTEQSNNRAHGRVG